MGVMFLFTFRDVEGRAWVGAALPGPLRPVGFEAEPIEPEDFPSAGMAQMVDFKAVIDAPAPEELLRPEDPSATRLEGEGETDSMSRPD